MTRETVKNWRELTVGDDVEVSFKARIDELTPFAVHFRIVSDVSKCLVDRELDAATITREVKPLVVGDVVRRVEGGNPYVIIAIDSGMAWIRGVKNYNNFVEPVHLFVRDNSEPANIATSGTLKKETGP